MKFDLRAYAYDGAVQWVAGRMCQEADHQFPYAGRRFFTGVQHAQCGKSGRLRPWRSGLMGGLLLMAADMMACWAIAPQKLPISVLTAILAGSYLLWLTRRRGGQASALG